MPELPERENPDNEAQTDELGNDPAQVGPDSARQSGDLQGLSEIEDEDDESVEELADDDQAFEAEAVEGVEDAADHPERPTHRTKNMAVPMTSGRGGETTKRPNLCSATTQREKRR
jgi:hypothetical protein